MDIWLAVVFFSLFTIFVVVVLLDRIFKFLNVSIYVFRYLKILVAGLMMILLVGIFGFSSDFWTEALLSGINRLIYRIIFALFASLVVVCIIYLVFVHKKKLDGTERVYENFG